MENKGGGVGHQISAEDVIAKLKDDGDFDKLRLKIIRKVKENEELRGLIIAMVKQSEALNGPGAGTMRPRQLADAIHQEVRDKVMSQISASLWEIIRSGDGMKSEITETVQSVYSKLVNPTGHQEERFPILNSGLPVDTQAHVGISKTASPHQIDVLSDNELDEPPGFSLSNLHQNHHTNKPEYNQQIPVSCDNLIEEQTENTQQSEDAMKIDDASACGVSGAVKSKEPCDGSDDDPDLPPGFS